jgi:hypothetical protein
MNSFNLDEVELKGDTPVERLPPEPQAPLEKKATNPILWLFLGLLMAACIWLVTRNYSLAARVAELESGVQRADHRIQARETDLEGANRKIAELDKLKAQLEQASEKERKRLAQVQAQLTEEERKRKEGEKDLRLLKEQAKQAAVSAEALTKKLAEAEQRLVQAVAEAAKEKEGRVTEKAELEKSLLVRQAEIAKQELARGELTRQLDLEREKNRQESAASLVIIRERAQLKESNQSLREEVARLRADSAEKGKRIERLETLQEGQLVPFEPNLVPGEVLFREPLVRDGLPRRFGPYCLMVLVDELGRVQNAFLLPGQAIESQVARALLQNVKLWKFTPPSLRGIRVRTWQPVLIGES